MTHIASPFQIRNIKGRVLTTECHLVEKGNHKKFETETFFIEDEVGDFEFQRHKVLEVTE